MNIVVKEIHEAYLTLKRSIYYENNVLLHLKMQIADFEKINNFLNKNKRNEYFNNLANKLNSIKEDEFDSEITNIKYRKVIKKLNDNSNEEILNIINNKKTNNLDEECIKEINKILESKNNEKISYNHIIECDISLHIISILWILKEGYKLDKKIDKYSYGYRLNLDSDNNIKNRTIFKKYIEQYQNWKNNGVKKIKQIIEEDENVVVINLDLKSFYYSINHKKLIEKIAKEKEAIENSKLTKLILKINKQYDHIVSKDKSSEIGNILPIGLYSSAILANFYLNDLDNLILQYSPTYYGRYVDDILIIFKEYQKKILENEMIYFKNKFPELINNTELEKLGIEKSFNEDILNQNKKQKITFLKGSKRKIEATKLENTINENTSTFLESPTEEDIEILYKTLLNKDEEFKVYRYDVSVYLAKLLSVFSDININNESNKLKKISEDLITFFSSDNIIKYAHYFEKIFIYLIKGELVKEIEEFFTKIDAYIKEVNSNKTRDNQFILDYFNISFYFAIALNPKLIDKFNSKFINKRFVSFTNLKSIISSIIDSNMFKQNMVNYPLLNYIKNINSNNSIEKINFFNSRYFDILDIFKDNLNLELDENKLILSPRFIHFDEFNIFYIKNHILSHNLPEQINSLEKSKIKFALNFSEESENIKRSCFSNYINTQEYNCINFTNVKSENNQILKKVRIGIASLPIKDDNLKTLDGKQDLSMKRKDNIINILNKAKLKQVDILIFPEISIPFQWLKIINKFSRKNNIVVTGGLDHIYSPNLEYNDVNKPKYAFNYLFTTLPFFTKNYRTSTVKIRLKNYYAPDEKNTIEGKKFIVPKLKNNSYDIFSWQGVHFSNFNCFELSDIEGRSKLKNYIDLLIASVHNKDLSYFQNILESTCRDLHIFVAQSNTSIYGNCEIIQPTKKDFMTIASIKGGLNDNLLIGDIDIEKLREFQLLDNNLQKGKYFKLTPPGIDPNKVKNRINNNINIQNI